MNDMTKIIIGLIIFIIVITLPITYNLATQSNLSGAPELVIPPEAGNKCIESKEYMRANHMDLLNQWRDQVVRQGVRFTTGPNGNQIEMSLTRTCLDCHSNNDDFCNKCHDYMAVEPYCWDCHITPQEEAQPQTADALMPKEEQR